VQGGAGKHPYYVPPGRRMGLLPDAISCSPVQPPPAAPPRRLVRRAHTGGHEEGGRRTLLTSSMSLNSSLQFSRRLVSQANSFLLKSIVRIEALGTGGWLPCAKRWSQSAGRGCRPACCSTSFTLLTPACLMFVFPLRVASPTGAAITYLLGGPACAYPILARSNARTCFLLGSSAYVCLQIAKVLQHYEGMVFELHLSHNDITNEGAKRLLVKEVIQHYPIHQRGQLRKPLWLRLEQCRVNSRLGLPAWMYTADKQRMKPQPDCPPLQVPHLDLPVPAADAYRNRPPETRLPRQQPISPAPQALQAHSAAAPAGGGGAPSAASGGGKTGPSAAAPAPGGRTLAACACDGSACNSEWCLHTRVSVQDAGSVL